MAKLTRLGELERAVMDHLWSSDEPQTVRQVHEALSARRDLAYTTIMTVLQRLAKKNLVVQHRDDRAHRYAPMHGRDELVAGLMVDALDQAADSGSREAALVHFVERVGADEAAALRRALAELESKTAPDARSENYTADARSGNYTADARSGNYTEAPPAGNPGTA
jgi:predicted transcriptional regulator